MEEFKLFEVIIEMTKELREELDAIDWSKAGEMTDWLGDPNMTISAGTINAREISP